MADSGKSKKGSKSASLSAARRMLKEYQQNQPKKPLNNIQKENIEPSQPHNDQMQYSNENNTPIDSLASSTTSLNIQEIPKQEQQNLQSDSSVPQTNQLHDAQNYFNNALFQQGGTNHILTNYFDNIPKNDENINNFYQNVNLGAGNPQNVIAEAINLTYATYDNTNPIETQNDSIQLQNEENNAQSEFMGEEITFGHVNNPVALIENAESAFDAQNQTDVPKPIYSNTESLRQLSSQLNNLLETENLPNSTDNVLEARNQELAALLEQERQKNDQFNLQIREYTNRITQLETENQQIKNEYDARLSKEMGPLQEQLQYHVQTFGILVGEKTELSTALNQSQSTVKLKTAECEELQSRLRASRHRVSELEKEINLLKALKENINKSEQETNREIERHKLEYGMLKDQFNEVSEEATEVKEKLNMKINELQTIQGELQEKNSQLSLAQLRIQQLTVGENVHAESQLEVLTQQKISLEKQVSDLTQTIKLVSTERDQASQQYQQYVQQLNTQLQNFSDQLQIKTKENEMLSNREQSLIKHISELEKHLQQLQNEKSSFVSPPDNSSTIKGLEENISQLEKKIAEVTSKYDEEFTKREKLESEIEEKGLHIGQLEFKVEQMMSDRPDTGKLLAAMESDKIAASRATEQNQKLKNQLAELQDGFVLMSNSKLELTEKLENELHRSKEVTERLTQKEADFEKLHNLISYKDKEILDLENQKTDLSKQILQQTQQLDRLRHYEANGNVMELLQKELEESNKNLEAMVSENAELSKLISELQKNLQEKIAEMRDCSQNTEAPVDNVDNINVPKEENLLNQSIRKKIECLENTNAQLEKKIKDMRSEPDYEIKHAQYLDKEKAMQQLEERFTKTMAEVAELTEEKQRLEHLVLQLQSETETIGEYITLYQCQRAILKQKTIEKDEQLERLNRDREAMKFKLDELNNLIKKLVIEKGDIPEEVLNNKLLKNINYCDAHKIDDKNDISTEIINGGNENNNLGTAGQIIALLSEIKTSNLIQPNPDNIQNFHPCPCCSGKLLTV